MPKLTSRKADSLREPGMHSDGDGLYLRIGPTGAKSWILRTRIEGRVTASGKPLRWEGGLGSYNLVSLAEAREKARELRKVARSGGDPSTAKRTAILTFREAAQRAFDSHKHSWRNSRHAKIWWASLENYALPKLGNRPIVDLGTADVHAVLDPIWTEKHETAKRLKQRVATVFDWAKGAGHYPHENPLNGLKKALPVVRKRVEHMPSLPWQEVSAYMAGLARIEGVPARTLEFLILTAARSGEARGARWSEFDLNRAIWTVPAERMKGGRSHRVPLSPQALVVLEQVRGMDSEVVFPSSRRGKDGQVKGQSVTVFKDLLTRMKSDGITVHGFRSSFRDWASESAHAERTVAEAALAHTNGSEVEQAYHRTDLLDRRRKLMDAWGRFCAGEQGAVVQMVRG